ncbi:hypothetical protein Vadar_004082 [Vaccinium darrowii]|uniref:Uncharacterized protein n=1 Tax=Vaccinium darrowii TaxID=229202 RepID=A0ACB7ZI81_9ERIC|nr:hypothetical protein Vadar_004082 [Vaccinium darrowii]
MTPFGSPVVPDDSEKWKTFFRGGRRQRVDARDFDVVFERVGQDFVDVAVLSYDELRFGGFGLFQDFRWGEEGVGHGAGGAEVGGGEEGEDEFRRVREQEHDRVVLFDSVFAEADGDSPGGELDVGIGVDFTSRAVDQAGVRAVVGDVLEDVGVEGEVVGDVDVREL